jgi:hypothetical protein
MKRTRLGRYAVLASAFFALSGCGLVHDDQYGALLVNLDWPQETRAIPTYAKSARIILHDIDGYGDRVQIISRNSAAPHTDQIRFDTIPRRYSEEFPYYDHTVEVIFYTGSGGTGSVLASAFYTFRFRDFNWTHNFTVAPYTYSEIQALRIDGPFNVSMAGGSRTLQGTGLDAYQRIIPIPPRALLWEQIGGDAGTIDENGTVTPTKPGSITVRMSEADNAVDPVIGTISVSP